MNIFGLTITRAKAAPPQGLAPIYADRGHWWPIIREPFTGAWQKNLEENAQTLLTHSTVYACVSLISSDISKLNMRLVQKNETTGVWKEVTSPAFSPVLRKPNSYQNRIKFLETWITSKLLHGNTYVLKFRDNRNVVVGLYILDPTRTRVMIAPDGSVYYQLSKDNLSGIEDQQVTVPASEVIHDLMSPLYHPLVGVSPLSASGGAAIGALSIQRNSSRFFQNGSKPGGVLTAPGTISQETADRLKSTWGENFSGDNYGKVAVLGDGLKYEALTISAADSQLIEQLKWDAETICSTFHVPAYMVGVGASPSYNNIEALNQQYYSQCLQALIECVELCLDEGLGLNLLEDKIMGVELDLDGLLRMDTATRVKTYSEGIKGGLFKPNEGRAKMDLEPVTGGDQVYLQQQNYSLEALAKRDAKDDPFSTSKPAPVDDEEPEDEAPDDEELEAEDEEDLSAEEQARALVAGYEWGTLEAA